MEMALIEAFCSYNVNKMRKNPFTSVVIFIFRSQCNIEHFLLNRVSEPLVRSKMTITLELKRCLSNFQQGNRKRKGYQGRNNEF